MSTENQTPPADRLADVERRLRVVEVKLGLAPDPQVVPNPLPATTPVVAKTEPVPLPTVVKRPDPVVNVPAKPAVVAGPDKVAATPPSGKPSGGSMEAYIGAHWLSRIGVAILVVGLAYGVVQAYQHLGPLFKIGCGLAAGLTLVGGGEWLSRRPKFRWYGAALVGGGYALTYFVVYAMQNIAGVKLMDNVVTNLFILLGLSAAAMTHAVFKRLEPIAALSSLLAFATISLSPITGFSVLATAIITCGLAAAVYKMRWFGLFAVSVVGSYLTYALATHGQLVHAYGAGTTSLFWMSLAFLGVFWGVFQTLSFLLNPNENDQLGCKVSAGAPPVNMLAFVGLVLAAMGTAHLADYRYVFLAITGVVYLGLTYLAGQLKRTKLSLFSLLAGLALVSAAVPFKFDGQTLATIWFIEAALLVVAGLRTNVPALRWFALPLSVISTGYLLTAIMPLADSVSIASFGVERRVLASLVAIIAFAVSMGAYRVSLLYSRTAEECQLQRYASLFYGAAGLLIAWVLPLASASPTLVAAIWAAEALVLLALAFNFDELYGHLAAGAVFVAAGLWTVGHQELLGLWHIVPVIGLGAIASIIYAVPRITWGAESPIARHLHQGWLVASVLLTGAHTILNFQESPMLGTYLGLEALALLLVGIAWRDLPVRALGFAGLAVACIAFTFSDGDWSWTSSLGLVGSLYAAHLVYRRAPAVRTREPLAFLDYAVRSLGQEGRGNVDAATLEADGKPFLSGWPVIAGSLLLAVSFYHLMDHRWLALSLTLEGLGLVVVGFGLMEKVTRWSGLAMFVPAIARLLFVDLAGAAPMQRVLSFVLAGLALVAASFVYTWLGNLLEPPQDKGPDDKDKAAEQTDTTAPPKE